MTARWFSRAALDVLAERRRQTEAEGWTPEHDDRHVRGEMADAAACYLLDENYRMTRNRDGDRFLDFIWPWKPKQFKPKSRRADLVRGAALALAEIERLDRLEGRR